MPDGSPINLSAQKTALVLAGGASMGSFEAGAYAALHQSGWPLPGWVAGSSIGAITAVIIVGNAPENRIDRLQRFWKTVTSEPTLLSYWFGTPSAGVWRQHSNDASAIESLLFGRRGLFRPRLSPGYRMGAQDVSALYDLAPLRDHLAEIVDFDRINGGEIRLSLAATDVVTGERVIFDTHQGTKIVPEHVLASSALLPLFAPIEVDGRLLADGGLSSNAPLDVVLADPASEGMMCFVVDLFAREGSRPHTLGASVARATDLSFGNQTRLILEGQEREHRLRAMIGRLGRRLPEDLRADPEIAAILVEGRAHQANVLYLSFRASVEEAGPLKAFDFSRATLAERWKAGEEEMQEGLRRAAAAEVEQDGLHVTDVSFEPS